MNNNKKKNNYANAIQLKWIRNHTTVS